MMIRGVGSNASYHPYWRSPDLPAPTITTADQKEGGAGWIMIDEKPNTYLMTDKPPYCVPSMAEIADIPWNGLSVASTFSGCGGSCLGYRMAGCRIVWANEFVPAAQASYKVNAAAGSFLDCRDIKHIQPDDILQQTGLAPGALDIFDGSPPCQAFSTAGKRAKGWGEDKVYEHGARQKNETLFAEYIRLLRGLQPRVFVAENVSGLVKGVAKGYFKEILADLKASGYQVEARLLDAQWLGVPQMRQRIIFMGVRNDLGKAPAFPKPLPYRYSVREALPWIDRLRQDPSWQFAIQDIPSEQPCFTIKAGSTSHVKIEGANGFNGHAGASIGGPMATVQDGRAVALLGPSRRKFTIAELKRICAFPDDFVLAGSYAQQWERLGNAVPPVMMKMIAAIIRDNILCAPHRESL